MQEIYRLLARLMQTDLTVMITGESGTGKELVARALHDYGKRRNGPFVAINMAAIPRDLIESELFGHEKGAFTGANTRSAGRFEQAEGGTLFLDEIGDMPMEAQTRLLRVLQQGEYTTVGGRTPIKTDVRIVAATNKDLRSSDPAGAVPRGSVLPPQRRAAAPAAAARARRGHARSRPPFLRARREREGLAATSRSTAPPLERLKRYRWPGNVRELENLARRLAALYPQETITDCGHRGRACRSRRRRCPRSEPRAEDTLGGSGRAALDTLILPASTTACRRPASITASCARSNIRCCRQRSGGDTRQPDPGRRPARPQPQHPAQEDPRPRHPGLSAAADLRAAVDKGGTYPAGARQAAAELSQFGNIVV